MDSDPNQVLVVLTRYSKYPFPGELFSEKVLGFGCKIMKFIATLKADATLEACGKRRQQTKTFDKRDVIEPNHLNFKASPCIFC